MQIRPISDISVTLPATANCCVADMVALRLQVDGPGLLVLCVEIAGKTRFSRRWFRGSEIDIRVPTGCLLRAVHYGMRGRRQQLFQVPDSALAFKAPDYPRVQSIRLAAEVAVRAIQSLVGALRFHGSPIPKSPGFALRLRDTGVRVRHIPWDPHLPSFRVKLKTPLPWAASHLFKVPVPKSSGTVLP